MNSLSFEVNRLLTFNDWSNTSVNKHSLAKFGFFYTSVKDNVKCFFCGVEIGAWHEDDNVFVEHKRWSNYCPLLNLEPTTNIAIDPETFYKFLCDKNPIETIKNPVDNFYYEFQKKIFSDKIEYD